MAKIRNFDILGAVFPHFCPDKREIRHGGAREADLGSATPCEISRLSGQRVAPAGPKTNFWTTEYKLQTIPAWLRFTQACR